MTFKHIDWCVRMSIVGSLVTGTLIVAPLDRINHNFTFFIATIATGMLIGIPLGFSNARRNHAPAVDRPIRERLPQ